MFYHLLLAVHVCVCVLMILVVLLQTGKGAGLALFGSSGDSLITTPTGSSFMRNLTGALAGAFAFTSLFLSLLSAKSGMSSVTSRFSLPAAPASQQAPVVPPAPIKKK